MRRILLVITLLFLSSALISDDVLAGRVEGYYRHNGTYVAPYHRSNPNATVTDNYSFKGILIHVPVGKVMIIIEAIQQAPIMMECLDIKHEISNRDRVSNGQKQNHVKKQLRRRIQ